MSTPELEAHPRLWAVAHRSLPQPVHLRWVLGLGSVLVVVLVGRRWRRHR